MDSQNRVGVVTVAFNSGGVLTDFLRCLGKQTHGNFLLFVVDNSSNDDTLAILDAWGDERLRIIANSQNKGVAEGNNQGIQKALEEGCSSVLLINNDTEFAPTLIADLLTGLNAYQSDMTCPKMMYFDEPHLIWAAGGRFLPWLGYTAIQFGEGRPDRGQHNYGRFVTYVPTCCVLIRKAVFETIGLMDQRYFVYVDDVDFMYRAMRSGLKLRYLPEATLLHKVGRLTGGGNSPFATRFGTRNRLFFLLKHFGLLPTVPWMIFCEVIWFFRSLVRRDGIRWFYAKHLALRESLHMWTSSRQSSD